MAKNPTYLLDIFSQRDVRLGKQQYDAIANYYWDHYSYFAHKRSLIFDDLKNSLANNCQPYSFSSWQRVVDYKFSLDPLSAKGSVLNNPGGRFNIGDMDQTKFSQFAALYIAGERDTAYKEKFGLYRESQDPGISTDELVLTCHNPVTIAVVKGEINQVLNLTHADSLKDFYELIKNIHLPARFIQRAKQLNLESPMLAVRSLTELNQSILLPNWRDIPILWDIPANSQILGQVAYEAGIEAILYPSKITGKNCLAIFPKNFEQSASCIILEGESPKEVKNLQMDCQNYFAFI